MHYDASQALPAVTLTSSFEGNAHHLDTQTGPARPVPADPNFVVEVEFDGTAYLRFGDNTNGAFAANAADFIADLSRRQRHTGNVGAGEPRLPRRRRRPHPGCTNPLPAAGGVDPETTDQIRRRAPQAFLTQERAITMPDYVAIAERNTQIDEAVATLRWTGSWYTVFLAAEPQGRRQSRRPRCARRSPASSIAIGSPARTSSLNRRSTFLSQIELTVCVDPNYFRADVQKALMQVLGSSTLPDGQKGLFAPDNFSFGQTVYLSPIYAAARKVAGVTSVTATVFQPQGSRTTTSLPRQGRNPARAVPDRPPGQRSQLSQPRPAHARSCKGGK